MIMMATMMMMMMMIVSTTKITGLWNVDKLHKFLFLACVVYVACLNRAGNIVSVTYILSLQKHKTSTKLSLTQLKENKKKHFF